MRCFRGLIFLALGALAGCATARSSPDMVGAAQGYVGQVVAVREVTGGAVTQQITRILGQSDPTRLVAGQEIVVKLTDGEVKSFVPPQGSVPAGLAPGDHVVITETPKMQISLR